MSQIPPQLCLWATASVFKHLVDQAGGVSVFIEGQQRNTEEDQVWYELRMDGPLYQQKTTDELRMDVEVNVLVSVVQDSRDIYKIRRHCGLVASMFTSCIPLKRYGDIADDVLNDETQIGVLQVRTERREETGINYFGKVRPDTNLEQATVEGHYREYLSVERCLS